MQFQQQQAMLDSIQNLVISYAVCNGKQALRYMRTTDEIRVWVSSVNSHVFCMDVDMEQRVCFMHIFQPYHFSALPMPVTNSLPLLFNLKDGLAVVGIVATDPEQEISFMINFLPQNEESLHATGQYLKALVTSTLQAAVWALDE